MDAEDADNRGRGITAFFRTYWYIVVPVLVMSLLLLVAGIVYLRCSAGSSAVSGQLPVSQQGQMQGAPPQGAAPVPMYQQGAPSVPMSQQSPMQGPPPAPMYQATPPPQAAPSFQVGVPPAMAPGYASFSPPAQAAPIPGVNLTRTLPISQVPVNQFYTSG